jgi:hypothetical protein
MIVQTMLHYRIIEKLDEVPKPPAIPAKAGGVVYGR